MTSSLTLEMPTRRKGIRIWAGIIGGIMVGPWKVPDGIKMTEAPLREHLES